MLWAARVVARAFGMVWELLSRLRRRPEEADPAEELRRKLAEARARDSEKPLEATPTVAEAAIEAALAPDQPAAELAAEPGPADLASLRRDVHARARALSEEMRGTGEGD
ncbi:MAG: hypothetical protein ACYDHO_02550 [Gaiellaceae bacterium]